MWLVDTNLLVYAVSPAEKEKQPRARAFLAGLLTTGNAALAVQNCAEFLRALALDDAMSILTAWSRHITILSPDFDTVEIAVEGVGKHQLSFWDAMIWAVAVQNQLDGIYTEDGPVGATLGGIRWGNPLVP